MDMQTLWQAVGVAVLLVVAFLIYRVSLHVERLEGHHQIMASILVMWVSRSDVPDDAKAALADCLECLRTGQAPFKLKDLPHDRS